MKKIMIPRLFAFVSIALIILFYFIFPNLNYIRFPYNFFGFLILTIGSIMISKAKKPQKKGDLVNNVDTINLGFFKISKNPVIFGMFFILLGISIFFRNIISLSIPFIFIILISIIYIPTQENKN
jgi:protein-S-isoprenylcysteine O-methyltransferase Ste14